MAGTPLDGPSGRARGGSDGVDGSQRAGSAAGSWRHCCQAASLVAYMLPIARANRITTSTAPSASVQVVLESVGVQELSSVSESTKRQALAPSRMLPHNARRDAIL